MMKSHSKIRTQNLGHLWVTDVVNVTLKLQMRGEQNICHCFFAPKYEKLLHCILPAKNDTYGAMCTGRFQESLTSTSSSENN